MLRNSFSILVLTICVLLGAHSILAGPKTAVVQAPSSVAEVGGAVEETTILEYFFATPVNNFRTRILPDRTDRRTISGVAPANRPDIHSVSTIPYSKARRALLTYQAPVALAIIPDAGGDAGEPRGGATLVVDDDLACANATYSTITAAIAAAANGDTVEVCAGTYNEDVIVNKSITLVSRDGAAVTIISGPIGGTDGATIRISSSNVTVSGFTITRDGNNTTDWNNGSLNFAGVAVQGLTIAGLTLRDNIITGNRTAIDINNSGSHTIRNNQIIFNHTGMILRNQTDDMTIVENEIVNNRTVGILFLDASSGTNVPVQTALNCIISNNSIVGNWYGGIVDRQSGGVLPTPGTNLKNFSGNTFGTTSPVITTANSAEPGYATLIPVEYGGTATNPGGAPDVAGPASANFDITPMLTLSGDTNVETSLGNGTFGFQGDLSNLTVTSEGAQDGLSGRIQEGVDSVSGSEVHVLAGTYAEQVYIDSPVELYGAQAGVDARTRVAASESIIVPDISSPDPDAGFFISLIYVDASDVIIDGFTIDGDNPLLTSLVDYNGANIDAEDGISGFETGYDNITVTNNIIKNLSYTGVDFYPSGTVACTGNSITQNRVENLGGDFGDIGILIYNDFYASVDDNLVVDTSVGIQTGNFHLAGSPSSISDNEVSARDVGIFYNLHYQNASDFVVADNDISAVTNIYSPGSSTWVGAILWSQASAVSVAFTDNVIDGSASNNSATWGFSIWNLPTTVTPIITGGIISGVDLGAYIRNFHPTWLSGPVDVEFHGVDIQADDLGIWIHDHPSNANNDTSTATVTDNCSVLTSPTGTGIKIEGADASASITDNDASIFGNLIGIDVDGGSAAISGNHIYDNGTGVRSTNGGVITTLDANDFDDIDDNGTDLRMDASAGSVTIGAGNSFAGDDYYIDQRAAASHDLTGANSQNYDESDNFRIEDRMYHKLDATASGRVTWVSANRHVSAPGTGNNDETIQRAIDAGDAGDTVNIESGTFVEVFNINKVGMKVVGQGAGSTTIDYTGLGIAPGGVNGAIYSSQNDVELHDLSLTRSDADSLPRYGVKFDFASNMVVEGVAISNSFRTGLDLHGVLDVTVDGVSCTNNGGAGIFLTDVKGAALSNITTGGNPWVGVSVATSGQFTTLGTNGIVFSGTNSFGESAGDNGGLQLEMFDWTLNVPLPISWSANPADNADVTIQPADFAYALSAGAFDDPTHVWVRFHQSLSQAESAAAGNADHLVAGTRYIQEADDSNGLPNSGASDLYVIDTAGDTMSIQAAIEGSSSFHVDTIHIGDGSYPEDIDASANAVILSPGASPGITTIVGNMTLTGDDSLLIEVNGLTPGTLHDQWMILGAVDLGGAALDTTGSTIIATPGESVTIIDNDTSVDAVVGTFAGLSNGAAFLLNGQPFAVFYNGGDGNDVVLTRTNSLSPPATVYVDDDWAGTGNGVDPDGAGPASAFGFDAFDNIPDGVDAVASGGTVIVYAGSYDDGGTVTTTNIAILGPQAGVDPCSGRAGPEAVIDTANGDTEGAFVIQADGCTIDGFTIQNVNVAINVYFAGSPPVGGYNGLTARNCIIEHAAIDGVNLNYHGNSAPALVEANLIIDVGTSGITAGDDRGTPGVGDDIVTQATIRGNMVINAVFGITGYQTGSSILGNVVAVDAGYDGSAAASGGVGISGQLANTVIRANKVHGYDNVGGPYSTGIGFATYPNRPESTGVSVRQNSVYGNLIGIGVAHTSGTSIGIVASPGNLIYGNLGAGMVNTTTSLINATNNYWGDASGPLDPVGSSEVPPCNGDATFDLNADGAGNQVSDASFPAAGCSNIDYCPWSSGSGTISMESTDTCIGIGQAQIVVEVWSRSVSQSLTGWQAFVNYDTSRLAFNVAASTYTAAPFSSHFRTLGPAGDVEISTGLLGLDGNVGIGGTPDAGGDDLLATLVFDVVPAGWNECDQTMPVFTNFMTFYSELSLNGVAIPTALVDAPCFSRDTVAPSISCDITEFSPISVDSNCEAVFSYSALVTDNCGIDAADVSRTVLVTTANASVLASAATITQVDAYTVSVSGSATVSALTGCPATVELTVNATDSCGNNATVCTAEINVQDEIAPVIVAVADDVVVDSGCTASVPFSATITDNCCVSPGSLDLVVTVQSAVIVTAGTPVVSSVTPISANEIEIEGTVVVSNVTACPASVTLAFNAKDCCGNSAVEVTDGADVADNAAPVVTCGNVSVPSDAGFCTASVLLAASALDNCAGATAVSYYANLDANPDYETLISNPYVFSQGITEVQARSTDNCSNTGTCDFTVTVQDISKAKVTVVLEGVTIPTTRCISFVPLLSGGPCVQNALVNELSFVDHDSNPATPVRAVDFLVDIPCGDYESLCAKDEQHTLSDSHAVLISGANYEAVADYVLLGGDTDDDDDIDINDVTLLLAQFGTLSASGGCPWDGTRDADFSNNGARSTEDYVFLSDNWLEFRNCCAGNGWPLVAPPPSAQPVVPAVTLDGQPIRIRRYSISVVELSSTLVPADLTGDGVVDFKDVKRFETINGLPHVLSTRIQIDEQQAKSAVGKARTSP